MKYTNESYNTLPVLMPGTADLNGLQPHAAGPTIQRI